MEHSEAIQTKAAEAYLLGELSARERRAFEEHFFDCQECTRDLQAGVSFIDAYKETPAKGVATRPLALVQPRRAGGWRHTYALAASVLFAAVLLYQNAVTIPKLRHAVAPQALESFSLESTGSRGLSPLVVAPGQGKPFVILFDIPPGMDQSEYRCDIRSASGDDAASFRVSAALAQRTIPVLIPASQLKPGKYALVIHGTHQQASEAGDEVARYPFEIR